MGITWIAASAGDGLTNRGQDAVGITLEVNGSGKRGRWILDPRAREHEHDARPGIHLARFLHQTQSGERRRRLRPRPDPFHPPQELLRLDDGLLAHRLRMAAGLAADLEHL